MLAAGGAKMLNTMISGNQQVLGLRPAVGIHSSSRVFRKSVDPAGRKDGFSRRLSYVVTLPTQAYPINRLVAMLESEGRSEFCAMHHKPVDTTLLSAITNWETRQQ